MSPDDMFAESAGLPRVVLGSPGGGKSTLLNYMAQSAARGRLRCRGRRLLPVTARLAQWHEYTSDIVRKAGKASAAAKQNSRDSVTLLPRYLHSVYPEVKASQWKRFLKRGDVLLLFDGLDEVNDRDGRFVTEILRPTVRQYYKESPVVITCRTAAFDFHLYRAFFQGFPVYRLSGLDGGKILAYAKAYARIVGDDTGAWSRGSRWRWRYRHSAYWPGIRSCCPSSVLSWLSGPTTLLRWTSAVNYITMPLINSWNALGFCRSHSPGRSRLPVGRSWNRQA